MAASLGSLVVSLGLDAAEFIRGLTKAEQQAKKFSDSLSSNTIAVGVLKAEIALKAFDAAARLAGEAFQLLVHETARFKDLEEITGANAEVLASFAVSAAVAGTSIDAVAEASVKLTKRLAGVNDESKLAGAALAAIGISIKEFKKLDAAEQMERLAKALAQFDNAGGGKTAVLESLAKGGAQLLPFLKQLEEAGGRQTILTQAQIDAADKYTDSQARLRKEISLYAQAIAADALPVIGDFIKAIVSSFNKTGSLGDLVKQFSQDGTFTKWFQDAARVVAVCADVLIDWFNALKITLSIVPTGAEQIGALGRQFSGLNKILTGNFADGMQDIQLGYAQMTAAGKKWTDSISDAVSRTTLLSRVNKQFAISQLDARDAVEGASFKKKKPKLVFDGPTPAEKAAKAERLSDAEKYLQNLEKQLEKTHDLSTAEQVVVDVLSGRLKLSNGITEAQLLDVAQRIDAAKAEAKAQQEAAKAAEERARQTVRFQEVASRELEKISESNEALREEILILAGGEQARRAIEKARLSSAIALKEDTLATIENAGASEIEVDALKKQIELLKQRQGLLAGKNLATDLAAQAQLIKGYNDEIASSFANQFEAVVSGKKKAADALKDFAKDVEQMITRIAAKNIAEALFGGGKTGSGGIDIGSLIAKFIGTTGGGSFASGGDPPMNRPSLVGERGPEIFIPKVAGTIVPLSAGGKRGAGSSYNFNTNILPGATREAGDHAAAALGMEIRRSSARIM